MTQTTIRDNAVLALDVGGTGIKAGILRSSSPTEPLLTISRPTKAAEGPAAALQQVINTAIELRDLADAGLEITALGLCVPGLLNEQTGMVYEATNLGWKNLKIVAELEAALKLPIGFGHDVRTGALAEWRLGAGRGSDNMAFLAMGTGIAAGLVVQGELVTTPGSGEIGHGLARDGLPCTCGGRGCLETYASAGGIARNYTALSGTYAAGAREVLEAMHRRDVTASLVWRQAIDGIAREIAHFVTSVGTKVAVVGGGLVNAGDDLLVPLRDSVDDLLTIHGMPDIVEAQLGSNAGMFGAGLRAFDTLARNGAGPIIAPGGSRHPVVNRGSQKCYNF